MTTTTLERYIPLPQAAKRLGISPASLQGLIDSGNIRAAKLNGTIAVAETDLDQVITREQFQHLRGQAITVAGAVEKYNLSDRTVRDWIERGHINILKPGYGMVVDEADVAYCAAVYQIQGGGRGKRLFDESGQPYQLKHTEWADYQRERRKKNKPRVLTPAKKSH
jgi:hypothetical protein